MDVSMTKRDPYNDGYTHEALHSAHIACDMWDSHVLNTRCADEFPEVKAAIKQASAAMYNVYQLIGQKFGDNDADLIREQLREGVKLAKEVAEKRGAKVHPRVAALRALKRTVSTP